jgi:hypothetical protein
MCFVVVLALAQPKNNSPYSRFGLGDLLNQNFTNLRATPGFTSAYNDAYHLNLQNPASLGFLQMAAFDFGVYGRNSKWESATLSNKNWSGNMSHLALGFTLNNPVNDLLEREAQNSSWGMSIALVPYSLAGYTVETSGDVPDIGGVLSQFRGEGGTNQLVWATGYRYKQFAAGVSIGYLFGKIENVRNVIFEDINSGYQNNFTDDFSINGFMWKLGLQYNFIFNRENPKKIKVLTLGLTGNSNNSLNTNSSQFYTRLNPSYVLSMSSDTLINNSDVAGSATLPAQLGVGFILSGAAKWKIGANFDYSKWSSYKNDAKPETFSDTWRASFGGELTPDHTSYNNFWKRVRYRVGGFVGKDPRSIDNEQIGEYGVTFGVGFPITLPRQQVSFINLSVELGKRGANTSLQETYGEFTVGFTLNDNSWFFKRKFN